MQGQELEVLRAASPFKRIIFCGDGANDLCPSLALLPSDYVLARKVCTRPFSDASNSCIGSSCRAQSLVIALWSAYTVLCKQAQLAVASFGILHSALMPAIHPFYSSLTPCALLLILMRSARLICSTCIVGCASSAKRCACCVQGYKLHKLIEARAKEADASRKVAANVQLWETHEDLLRLTQIIVGS